MAKYKEVKITGVVMEDLKNITLRVDKELDKKINKLCKKIGVSKHSVINLLIFNYLRKNKELNL